ncbi:hypothetical protein AUP68_08809 [Ilyonectria robusta]
MGSAGLGDDIKTHAIASLAAGTMATTLCAPADVLKSRLQASAGKEVSSMPPILEPNSREAGTLDGPADRSSGGRSSVSDEGMDACVAETDVSTQANMMALY